MENSKKNALPALSNLEFVFSRSSGPGGQNVNKVNTQASVILDIALCPDLTDPQRALIRKNLANRIDKLGKLRITSSRHRSQSANKQDALERLYALLATALRKKKFRKPTKIPRNAAQKRLEQKKHHSVIKQQRKAQLSL